MTRSEESYEWNNLLYSLLDDYSLEIEEVAIMVEQAKSRGFREKIIDLVSVGIEDYGERIDVYSGSLEIKADEEGFPVFLVGGRELPGRDDNSHYSKAGALFRAGPYYGTLR